MKHVSLICTIHTICTISIISIISICLCSALAAEESRDGKGKQGKKRACKEKILEKFDSDKDGKLSESERSTAKAAMQERRQARMNKLKSEKPEIFAKIDNGF